MVLTTKEARYIIVLGIVISVLPISSTVLSTMLRVSQVHLFKIDVCLKWEMCYTLLDTFENISAK